MLRRVLPLVALCSIAACAKSPTTPSPAPAGGGAVLSGQTVDAVSGAPSGHLEVSVTGLGAVRTDDDGMFGIDDVQPGSYQASIQGAGVVTRQTKMSTSGGRARLSVIPTSFDLGAFDQMYRTEGAHLQRWRSQPALVIVASTLSFNGGSDGIHPALAEPMTDDEVAQLGAQLTDGLALLTGGTFSSFSSVAVERPQAGQRVPVLRPGAVVVGRYTGIDEGDGTVGYGRWSALTDGTIVGGAMFLDAAFDRTDARRRLLRTHELGHALGYQHVEGRTSIMNPVLGPEPTAFDQTSAVIAFDRAPGNRAPDIDPGGVGTAAVSAAGGAAWSPPVRCRVH